jgi:DNA polymerase I-like protein with 3'-5' exonuclease and polymerase domains
LLQGTGAVICKRWLVEYNNRMVAAFGPQGWDRKWASVLWVHDELESGVRDDIAEDAAAIAIASIEHMTQHFNFRCPLAGEAKLGVTWRDVH